MGDEALPTEKIGAFHWVKLGLTSATTIKWIVLLVLGAGTLTNEAVQNTAADLVGWAETEEEDSTIPEGETVVPAAGMNPEVRISLISHKSALDKYGAEITALRAEILQLEERREAGSERGDATLEGRIIRLEGYHD